MFQFSKLLEGRKATRRPSGKSAGLHTRLGFEPLERRELLSATMPSLLPQIDVSSQAAVAKTTGPSHTTTQGDGFVYYHYGNPDVGLEANLTGGLALEGGGKDVDAVYQWMGVKANGGDFLVLGTTGTDAYDSYISNLNAKNPSKNPYGGVPLNSVSTLVISSDAFLTDPSAATYIRSAISEASAIFIEGGDQSTYVNLWQGANNPVELALQQAIIANVPIGGTSAGVNVLGQYIFSAENGAAYSSTVLANPYDSTVTLDTGFLSIPALDNTIIDPHFYQRDRMGRLVTFMARLTNSDSQWAVPGTTIKGMGIDQQTALLVDTTGRDSDNPTHAVDFATVVGNKSGDVYFLETTGTANICQLGTPLGYTTDPISVRRATVGQTLNLDTIWTSTSNAYTDYTLTVMAGMLDSSQQGNSIY